jgi:starvation-inducible outer membrane lipoprotein
MRPIILLVMAIALAGCIARPNPYVNMKIPQSYLQALAKEEGITEEEARQKVMDIRGKHGNVTLADVQAGRFPPKRSVKPPAAPTRTAKP